MEMDGNSMERHNMHPYVTKLLPASWIFDDLWLGGGASPFSGTCPHAIVSFDPNRAPSVHRIWQRQAFQSTGFGPPRKQREMGKSTRNLNKPSITASKNCDCMQAVIKSSWLLQPLHSPMFSGAGNFCWSGAHRCVLWHNHLFGRASELWQRQRAPGFPPGTARECHPPI